MRKIRDAALLSLIGVLPLTANAQLTLRQASILPGRQAGAQKTHFGIVLEIRTVDNNNTSGWAGSDPGAWINSAEADLPDTGGIIDASGLTGAQTFATPIVLSKKTRLILGPGNYVGPSSGNVISVFGGGGPLNQGTCIVGAAKNLTTILPNTTAQAHGIYFSPTNHGNASYCVEDLTIQDATWGGTLRTAGAGIYADANPLPDQNSTGLIKNVDVHQMYYGIVLIRPFSTQVIRAGTIASKMDGIVLQGDGTTVALDNTFAAFSGRHDYAQHGVTAVTYINPATQDSLGDGIHIDLEHETTGQQAVGTSIVSPDVEAEVGDGIYCLDCIGLIITGMGVLNTGGDGIHVDGGRGINLISGQIKGSGGCGVNVTVSATPTIPGAIINQGTQLVANVGGNECGNAQMAYDSFGYVGSNLYRMNREIQLGPSQGLDQGIPITFFENNPPTGQPGAAKCYGDSTEHALMCSYNNDSYYSVTRTISSGTVTLDAGVIPARGCALPFTVAALGVTPSDTVVVTPAGPLGPPYAALTFSNSYTDMGSVDVVVCNPTSGPIIRETAAVNWRVTR